MRYLGLVLLPVLAAALAPTAASARRTVIDGNGPRVLQGYCDFNGADCSPQQLGFNIDFGNGPTSSFIIYGNGLVSFGNTPVDYAQSQNYYLGRDLGIFGGNVISAGLLNSIERDYYGTNQNVFSSSAYVGYNTPSRLIVEFEYCANINGRTTCSAQSSIDITRTASGLHVELVRYGYPTGYFGPNYYGTGFYDGGSPGTEAAGYSLHGTTVMFDDPPCSQYVNCQSRWNFDFVATVTDLPSGVPEPSSWVMMLLGFGSMGAALRRRPRSRYDILQA